MVHPDLLIVCKPISKQFLDFPPELVVGILSPSSRLKDQITKLELYQNFGIPFYLIVDPDGESSQFFELQKQRTYREVALPSSCAVADGYTISPKLRSVFRKNPS